MHGRAGACMHARACWGVHACAGVLGRACMRGRAGACRGAHACKGVLGRLCLSFPFVSQAPPLSPEGGMYRKSHSSWIQPSRAREGARREALAAHEAHMDQVTLPGELAPHP